MPTTRLSNEKREKILSYMMDEYERKRDKGEEATTLAVLVQKLNILLRSRFPEKDMVVLRKYKMSRVDTCLKFAVLDTGRVFEVRFPPRFDFGNTPLADIPGYMGCYNSEVFPCDPSLAEASDEWSAAREKVEKARRERQSGYQAFIYAAKTLEDVEAVVPLPAALRASLGATPNALVAANEKTLASIREDFAAAA
ncbi:MAG: hypothetical protein AB7F35_01060 [Acetobacteraceae bacterium]